MQALKRRSQSGPGVRTCGDGSEAYRVLGAATSGSTPAVRPTPTAGAAAPAARIH